MKGKDFSKVIFKHDMSILARDSPGPGNCDPLNGGIGDKIIV